MKDGFVTTRHGEIHYLEAGQGRPLILLHSNGGSAHQYAQVIDALGARYHVFSWDMPGHGDSDPITRHYSVEDYADAVIAFMDALGLPKASVMGSSIGGAISIALGARHAARIDHLFIVEAPLRPAEEWQKMWPNTEQSYSITTQSPETIAGRLHRSTPEIVTRWNMDRNKAGVRSMLDVMWALRRYDMFADVKRITTATTVVFGERGPTISKAEKYRELLPGARAEIIKDSGHFPMLDAPERLIEVIDTSMKG